MPCMIKARIFMVFLESGVSRLVAHQNGNAPGRYPAFCKVAKDGDRNEPPSLPDCRVYLIVI